MNIRWTGAAAGIAVAAAICLSPLTEAASLTGIYGPGSTGSAVRFIQSQLDQAGYHIPLTGYFGPITESAVKNYQSTHHLATDGIVGPLTEKSFTSKTTSDSASPAFDVARVSTYRVQPGNTLGSIAAQFHTSWQTLAQMNHLGNPNFLKVGQLLTVPGGQPMTASANKPAATPPKVSATSQSGRYTIRVGNTLSSIAGEFHTTWQTLAQLNHLTDPNNIAVGEVLVLPGSTSAPTTRSNSGSNSTSLPSQIARLSLGQAIVSTALKYLGVPYVWGDENPASGFDCSGLVQYVLGQNGISIGRTTWDQYQEVSPVSRANLVPGDLVFFTTYSPGASHVGIYIGSYPQLGYQQAFVDAPAPGQSVMVQNLNDPFYVDHYYGAGSVNP